MQPVSLKPLPSSQCSEAWHGPRSAQLPVPSAPSVQCPETPVEHQSSGSIATSNGKARACRKDGLCSGSLGPLVVTTRGSRMQPRPCRTPAVGLASMSQLPKVHRASSIQKTSRHIGVYWHKQKKCYTTRDFCGSFHTAAAAAHATGAERKRVKPSVLMQRVMCIRQAMGQKHISLRKQTLT